MMSDFYKTIKAPAEGLYKEKMSKFISFAHPIESTEEAKEIIIKKRKDSFTKNLLPKVLKEANQLNISKEELIERIRSEYDA